jgi:hypothetical protein
LNVTRLSPKVSYIIKFISLKLENNKKLKENVVSTAQFHLSNNRVRENNHSYNYSIFWKEIKTLYEKLSVTARKIMRGNFSQAGSTSNPYNIENDVNTYFLNSPKDWT